MYGRFGVVLARCDSFYLIYTTGCLIITIGGDQTTPRPEEKPAPWQTCVL